MKYRLKLFLLTSLPLVVLTLGIGHAETAGVEPDSARYQGSNSGSVQFRGFETESQAYQSADSHILHSTRLTGRKFETLAEANKVDYANLRLDSYSSGVRGVRAKGVVNESLATFASTVLSPIGQGWWLATLTAILALTAGYARYRFRLTRVLELERIRTRIASDLHDDIGASLSQIAIVSEVVGRQMSTGDARVAKNLQLIARTSREAIDSMSDIVWAINPEQDGLQNLVRRMRRFSSEVLPAKSIEFQFQAPFEDLRLGADIRRQVYLIFKECINNLVKHAQCTHARIDLRFDSTLLVLEISDNGCGLAKPQASDGQGLASMRRRAQSLGGSLEVKSDDRGTRVTLRVSFRHAFRFLPELVGEMGLVSGNAALSSSSIWTRGVHGK